MIFRNGSPANAGCPDVGRRRCHFVPTRSSAAKTFRTRGRNEFIRPRRNAPVFRNQSTAKIVHYFELQNKKPPICFQSSGVSGMAAHQKSLPISPRKTFSHTNINNTNNVWLNSIVPVAKIIQNAYRRNPYFQVFRHRELPRTVSESPTLPIRSHVGSQPESAEPGSVASICTAQKQKPLCIIDT